MTVFTYKFTIKRIFDIIASLIAIFILLFPLSFIWLLVKITSSGPSIYWSKRVGKNSNLFFMPKFRTMIISAPVLPTHLLPNPDEFLTPVGKILRKLSLDELPQFWSVLIGEMSIVGPRPALYNQLDLIKLRKIYGLDILRPGITGWAQINGRDDISIDQKIMYDLEYMNSLSFYMDLKIIISTIFKVIISKDIAH